MKYESIGATPKRVVKGKQQTEKWKRAKEIVKFNPNI